MVNPERNRLGDDIIEASECLKAWWDNGIVAQRLSVSDGYTFGDISDGAQLWTLFTAIKEPGYSYSLESRDAPCPCTFSPSFSAC